MRLVELLAIVKPEFHSLFNNLTKRKRHAVENPDDSIKVSSFLQDLQELEEEDEEVVADSNTKKAHFHENDDKFVSRSHFSRTHWARATTETMVKIDDFEEPIIALVDSGSEINIMSKNLFKKGNWPVDLDHGWRA